MIEGSLHHAKERARHVRSARRRAEIDVGGAPICVGAQGRFRGRVRCGILLRMTKQTCSILHRPFPSEDLTPLSAIRPQIAALIRRGHPELGDESLISTAALAPFRAEYVRGVLEEDMGELSTLEHDVVESLREHDLVTENVDAQLSKAHTRPAMGGLYRAVWRKLALHRDLRRVSRRLILINAWLGLRAADPYPFILLNLLALRLAPSRRR